VRSRLEFRILFIVLVVVSCLILWLFQSHPFIGFYAWAILAALLTAFLSRILYRPTEHNLEPAPPFMTLLKSSLTTFFLVPFLVAGYILIGSAVRNFTSTGSQDFLSGIFGVSCIGVFWFLQTPERG